MIHRLQFGRLLGIFAIFGTMGCSDVSGPPVKLVEAGGIVTYKNAPLANAMVTFVPEKGPVAMARTDLEGKFKLMTGGSTPGVAIGKVRVSVELAGAGEKKSSTADFQKTNDPAAREKMQENMKNMMQNAGKAAEEAESFIPKRYANAETSNLEFTVTANVSDNDFKIELKD
jgi:hypothetical protein